MVGDSADYQVGTILAPKHSAKNFGEEFRFVNMRFSAIIRKERGDEVLGIFDKKLLRGPINSSNTGRGRIT